MVRIVSWYCGCDPWRPSSTLPQRLWQDNEMLLPWRERLSVAGCTDVVTDMLF